MATCSLTFSMNNWPLQMLKTLALSLKEQKIRMSSSFILSLGGHKIQVGGRPTFDWPFKAVKF